MWNLVPGPEFERGPPTLGGQSLSCWTKREVSRTFKCPNPFQTGTCNLCLVSTFSSHWFKTKSHSAVELTLIVTIQSLSHVRLLGPHELQHTRLPCSSLSPGVCSNSWTLSQWCHPTISSSVIPFSSCPQSFPVSGSFPMSQFFTSGAKVLELQLQHQSFQWKFRVDFL